MIGERLSCGIGQGKDVVDEGLEEVAAGVLLVDGGPFRLFLALRIPKIHLTERSSIAQIQQSSLSVCMHTAGNLALAFSRQERNRSGNPHPCNLRITGPAMDVY
jgi:hypothetical protein